MVELTKQLLEILHDRKSTLTGEEIKTIVEAIAISESINKGEKTVVEITGKKPEVILREWLGV